MLGGGHTLRVEHTYGEDLHAIEELLDLGNPSRLAEGAGRLAAYSPAAVIWACTSGSFVYGWEGATEQAAKLAEAAGVPASSTSFAFVRATQAIGARKVAVAASYPKPVADRFVDFLAAAGIEVVRMSSHGIQTAAEVGTLPVDAVLELAAGNDHPDADAVLVPDTAMRTVALVDTIEKRIGKPVLTANQVTIWEALRLSGEPLVHSGLGTLFRAAASAGQGR
ncbi:maleate cis-trans isomerase [Fodinicola feengrottensis]